MPKETPKKVDWGQVLAQTAAGGGNFFFFPKEQTTRVRFLQSTRDYDSLPFRQVTAYWQGTPKSKFLIFGYLPDTEEIRGVILAPTAFHSLSAMSKEGWDFFDPEEGHGAVIRKDASGKRTQYTVMASRAAQPYEGIFPPDRYDEFVEELNKLSLDEQVKDWDEFQQSRLRQQGFLKDEKEEGQDLSDWD